MKNGVDNHKIKKRLIVLNTQNMYVDVTIVVECYPFMGVSFPLCFKMKGVKEEDIPRAIVDPLVAKEIKASAASLMGVYSEDIPYYKASFLVVPKGKDESRRDSWIDATQSPVFVKTKKFEPLENKCANRFLYSFKDVDAGPFADREWCVVEFPSFAELFRFNVFPAFDSSEKSNRFRSLVLAVISEHVGGRRLCFYDNFGQTDSPADIGFNIHLPSYKN